MSAYVLTDTHFAAIVGTVAARPGGTVTAKTVEIANMLGNENEISVAARYRETPGVVSVDPRLVAHFAANPLTSAEMVKALDCYAYQSCEHREWEGSEAHTYYRAALIMEGASDRHHDRANAADIRNSAAYDAAPWGIPHMDLGPDTDEPAPEARTSTGSALADIVLSVEDHGDESAALAALAISHRGLMRKALIALGTHTKAEARRVKRPEAERLIGAAIVRAALAHELASVAA